MRILAVMAVLLAATACGPKVDRASMSRSTVRFSAGAGTSSKLPVIVADTLPEQQLGLSGVAQLPAGDGMAFLYGGPTTDTFWMKDTLIPLSVAFVRADGVIVAIEDMTPCAADPCRTYASPEPYTLAIEANSGWYRTNGIEVGASAVLGSTQN